MKKVEIGNKVILKADTGFIRCDVYQDDAAIVYHIVSNKEEIQSSQDILSTEPIARALLGKKTDEAVDIPLEDTDLTFLYYIDTIL